MSVVHNHCGPSLPQNDGEGAYRYHVDHCVFPPTAGRAAGSHPTLLLSLPNKFAQKDPAVVIHCLQSIACHVFAGDSWWRGRGKCRVYSGAPGRFGRKEQGGGGLGVKWAPLGRFIS